MFIGIIVEQYLVYLINCYDILHLSCLIGLIALYVFLCEPLMCLGFMCLYVSICDIVLAYGSVVV